MIYIIIAVVVLVVLLGSIRDKSVYSPSILLSIFFGLICFLSSLQLYGMNKTSNEAYLIVLVGIISFYCGTVMQNILSNINKRKVVNTNTENYVVYNYQLKTKILFILVLCMTAYTFLRFMTILPLLLQGYALDYIRLIYFGNEFNGVGISHLTSVIEMFINLPLLYAAVPIVIVDFLSNKNREISKYTILLTILWVSLSTINSGGRATLYIVAIQLIFAAIILKRRMLLRKGSKIVVFIIIVASIIFMFFMTANRAQTREYDIFYSLYVYFSGCMAHLTYRLGTIDIAEHYTYGMTLISGLLRPVMLVYKWVMGDFPLVYQKTIDIGVYLQSAVDIGTGKTYNAFVPSFYYLYHDFGYVGITIGSILWGCASQIFFVRMKNSMAKIDIAVYLLVVQGIFTSMIRYPFILVYYTFAFFLIFLFYTKKTMRKGNVNDYA